MNDKMPFPTGFRRRLNDELSRGAIHINLKNKRRKLFIKEFARSLGIYDYLEGLEQPRFRITEKEDFNKEVVTKNGKDSRCK